MSSALETHLRLSWGVPGGAWTAAILGTLLAVVVVWGLRQLRVSGLRRASLIALRLSTALFGLALATQPTFLLEKQRTEPGALAVVLDASRSMGVATEGMSRMARAQQLLARWLAGDTRHVQWYRVGEALDPIAVDAVKSVGARAPSTRLLGSVSELTENEELGAVVVLSDGRDTTGAKLPSALSTKVHAVHVGDARPLRDDAIAALEADSVAFLHGDAKVQLSVRSVGLGERSLTVLLKRDDQVIASKVASVPEGGEARVELSFSPKDLGREAYWVELSVDARDDVPQNNRRAFLVRVTRDRLRALHVSGRPSWDQRFLRGFLKRDPSVDLVSFFILRSVHDLTMSSPTELALIPFPTDELFRQHLDSFDVVVMQDFDYAPYQMARYLPLLRDYVLNGGGLAMIGGSLSFDGGGYGETALADVLPVRMRPTSPNGAVVVEGEFEPVPVAVQLHHPLLELYPEPAQTLSAFKGLYPLRGLNALLGARKSAVTLLEHPTARGQDQQKLPVLVVGRHGHGRSLAFATDSSWHWSMPTAGRGGDPSVYDRFWDRAIRWLTRDPLLDESHLTTEREAYLPDVPVRVEGRLRSEQYLPLAQAEVTVAIRGVDGVPQEEAVVRADERGRIVAELRSPGEPGLYHVVARVDGKELVAEPFVVELSGVELASPSSRPEALAAISQATGGDFFASVDDAPDLAALDVTRTVSLGSERHAPFSQARWALLLLALILAEWALRRSWGER